jgi:hypothetical protein
MSNEEISETQRSESVPQAEIERLNDRYNYLRR